MQIPPKLLTDLWRLREFAGQDPIASQVKRAITTYIDEQAEELSAITMNERRDAENEE